MEAPRADGPTLLIGVCVSVDPDASMVPVSLWTSLVAEGTALLSAGPWTVAVEHECQICRFIRPPRNTDTLIPAGMTGKGNPLWK